MVRGFLRLAGFAGALSALAACADIVSVEQAAPKATALALYGGRVSVVAPANYCIANSASRPSEGFGVLVNCTTLRGEPNLTAPKGVVTVQVAEVGTAIPPGEAANLPAFFRTDAGRALLSQSGSAADITVEATAQSGSAVIVRFADAAPPPIAGLYTTEWRGFFPLNGRLATVSARGVAEAPLGTDEGQQLVERVIDALQVANPGAQSPTDS